MNTLQVNLTQELVDALLNLPKEVTRLTSKLDEVLEENRDLKLGLQHFTKDEVCKLLRVSKFTLDAWEDRGILVPLAIGQKRLYSGAMILAFSREQQVAVSRQEADWRPTKIRKLHSSGEHGKVA